MWLSLLPSEPGAMEKLEMQAQQKRKKEFVFIRKRSQKEPFTETEYIFPVSIEQEYEMMDKLKAQYPDRYKDGEYTFRYEPGKLIVRTAYKED